MEVVPTHILDSPPHELPRPPLSLSDIPETPKDFRRLVAGNVIALQSTDDVTTRHEARDHSDEASGDIDYRQPSGIENVRHCVEDDQEGNPQQCLVESQHKSADVNKDHKKALEDQEDCSFVIGLQTCSSERQHESQKPTEDCRHFAEQVAV